jgi:hypothetical protein
MDVWNIENSRHSLLGMLMQHLETYSFRDFSKKEIETSFEFHATLSIELRMFLFERLPPGGQNRFTRTINTILEILTNLNIIELTTRQGYFRLKGLEEERRNIRYRLGLDQLLWSYVLIAKSDWRGVLKFKNKKEIFNSGKGLFWNSLSYLKSQTQCSHFLIWLSSDACTISQKYKTWILSVNEEQTTSVDESLEWVLEPLRRDISWPADWRENDGSLLYQAQMKIFDMEYLFYFWEILGKLGYSPKYAYGNGIVLSVEHGDFSGIEYDLDPRGQMFDGSCLATSFELICDHLTRPLPAIRNIDGRSNSIQPNHRIDNFGYPNDRIHIDGTELQWNQGMLHSSLLGQTPRMWLLAESFGFTVALHCGTAAVVSRARAKLPWYGPVEELDFSKCFVELELNIDSWKQRLIEVLLRGNLPLICIDSDDYLKSLQNGTYAWADGDTAAKRDNAAKENHRGNQPISRDNYCEEQIGHAIIVSGVHLRKPTSGDPVLMWKILDSNPGHGFMTRFSGATRFEFNPDYSDRKIPHGGSVVWMTTNELYNIFDRSRDSVWIHEISWAKYQQNENDEVVEGLPLTLQGIYDACHTAKYRPLSNLKTCKK